MHFQLLVRDGGNAQADLLLSDSGANPPSRVETSQNKLWLEFIAPYDGPNLEHYGGHKERFAATFETYGRFFETTLRPVC